MALVVKDVSSTIYVARPGIDYATFQWHGFDKQMRAYVIGILCQMKKVFS